MISQKSKRKLSASALNTFLKSPRAYYWQYKAEGEGIVPIQPSVATFDHDKICGVLWAEFVDRFYHHVSEKSNTDVLMANWLEQTDGWVPEKARQKLTDALTSWASQYYIMFSPDDGARNGSELHLENKRFVAYLDGLSPDKVVHEVKSTSRSPQLAGQLWKVQNSIQVKLYCVMAKATGICIEFAFKDSPHQLFRGPVALVTEDQLKGWEQELNGLADYIYSLGDDIHNYPCHPDGCCLATKGGTWMCQFMPLCDGVPGAEIAYKPKTHRK